MSQSQIGARNTDHPAITAWVEKAEALCRPDRIFWCDGSDAEKEFLIGEAVRQGVLVPLNQEKWPGCYYHRSNPNDVARVEQFTYICTPLEEEAGPTNNWAPPAEMYSKLYKMAEGSMRGRTMCVVPYLMGPPGSPLSKVGIELTDSIYVVLSMGVMTRMGGVAYEHLGDSRDFNRGLHCVLDVNPERRLIVHFPQDNTIISVGSNYGGNGFSDRLAGPALEKRFGRESGAPEQPFLRAHEQQPRYGSGGERPGRGSDQRDHFRGRRATTMPLVFQAFNWIHGVFVGATMGSETTAAAAGAVGQVRRDPMAMLPFCGYNMGTYFSHWLKMWKLIKRPPKIFHVNWFRKGAEGGFLWPGFGENMRILKWIVDRCQGGVGAYETPIGWMPSLEDIDLEGMDYDKARLEKALAVDIEEWKKEVMAQDELFIRLHNDLPMELHFQRELLISRL